MHLSNDCKEFIALLRSEGVDFLVVGAAALAAHGRPRYTGDIDLWIRCDAGTAKKMESVLARFGFQSTGLQASDFAEPDRVVQLGVAPNRVDILTGLTGLDFDAAWKRRVDLPLDNQTLPFLDKESLCANKRATARPQDLADLEALEDC